MNESNTVLVIGNGFDLNLGLKTAYTDFIKSDDFKNLVRPNSIFAHLEEQHKANNWVDVEIELKRYSNSTADTSLQRDHQELCRALMNYISKIDFSEINYSSKAFKLIEEVAQKNPIIFDFNFTESLFHIANKFGLDWPEFQYNVKKVHGSCKEGNIIFGVEDHADIRPEDVFLKKSFPIYYKPINLSDVLLKATEIHFFGYSLGETDHTYLINFFRRASNPDIVNQQRIIYLYYYNEAAYKDLHMQLDYLTGKSMMFFKSLNFFKPEIAV